jgi:hypothetical protein
MPACGGDLERSFGGFLGLYINQVRVLPGLVEASRGGLGQQLRTLEVTDQCQQVRRRQNFDVTGPCGLAARRRIFDNRRHTRRYCPGKIATARCLLEAE